MPACVLYVFVDFFQCHSRFYEAFGLCASLTLVVPLAQLDWCATLSFWSVLAFFRLDFGLPLSSRFRYLLPCFSSGDFDYILCKLNELEYAKSRWKDNLQIKRYFPPFLPSLSQTPIIRDTLTFYRNTVKAVKFTCVTILLWALSVYQCCLFSLCLFFQFSFFLNYSYRPLHYNPTSIFSVIMI